MTVPVTGQGTVSHAQFRAQRIRSWLSGAATVGALVLASFAVSPRLAAAPSLDAIVQYMDDAAATWRGMRARVKWTRYRSLVDETRVESGRIAVRRRKAGDIEMLLKFSEPAPYSLSVRGTKVEIYKPRIKLIEEYNLSESRDQLENALMIGFGTAGTYLSKHYDIAIEGEEEIGGHLCVLLDLQPKNAADRLNNRRIKMWISPLHWQPVQQKVYERNPRDFRIYTYSGMELNPAFSAEDLRLQSARGTKRVRPQR